MKRLPHLLVAASLLAPATTAAAQDRDQDRQSRKDIIVTGRGQEDTAGTKTSTPPMQVPQPVTVIDAETYLSQGALSVSDTLRYAAGVQANSYGLDSRVDSSFVRGVNPVQYRDGMRDIYGNYVSTTADPYNFSRVELVRGPASVLFGQGSIGGIVNLVSKTPEFETSGEASVVYGSYDRKEFMGDVTGAIGRTLAARLVTRVRDADTQTDYVPDDRVLVSPSLRWRPSDDTDVTLIGLYQEDDGGSTAQFLPVIGTLYPNPNAENGRIPFDRFIGDPDWDRYDGRLAQGTILVDQRLGNRAKLSLKARYIDSDQQYFTHYPDSYQNPTDPYVDADHRIVGLYGDGTISGLNIFTTDNNVQVDFDTGSAVEHVLLAGVDYSWYRIRQRSAGGYEEIDIYDPDYAALTPPEFGDTISRSSQHQLGFYVQDQIRLWDRVSVVLGARHDDVTTKSPGSPDEDADATSLRAGIIGDLGAGFAPFFSYTESFLPVAGLDNAGDPYKPSRGKQFEAGLKWQPDPATRLTVTGFHITESNRLIDDPTDPTNQIQAGELTSKGVEFEGFRRLPGDFELIANFSYTDAELTETDDPIQLGRQLNSVPKYNWSIWTTKSFAMDEGVKLRLGAGVRHRGETVSRSAIWTVRTPDATLVDALAAIEWDQWRLSVNANNLLGKEYYGACLARGDCFLGAKRNVFATLTWRFGR
ncbi:TonB-dependent siderophore receptor [Stakelama saccharophila]|uniref:TonB-dependent siderophore receptor n=1 Tax=Stakelama saccharophila TaxID=3075605 RepID=A0ABZ0BAZ6_9SPHN|nr:TonB-dependent siderophore receptor [Stakelama sp. W311]WNO54592.1 TonB-dependent siderophore receptor [Stakelama sp. W311]